MKYVLTKNPYFLRYGLQSDFYLIIKGITILQLIAIIIELKLGWLVLPNKNKSF